MANVEHSVLTGSDLHESKGVAAAAANRVYVTNGAGSGSFVQVPAAAIAAAGVLVFQGQYFHARDERSSGTAGSALTDNSWNTRPLNTEVTDDLSLTISSNQISLVAGTYYVEAVAGTYFEGTMRRTVDGVMDTSSKLRIRNITDSTTLLNGLNVYFDQQDDGGGNNQATKIQLQTSLSGRFTIGGTKVIEIQNWVKNNMDSSTITKTQSTGVAASSGENEVYLDFKLWKLA